MPEYDEQGNVIIPRLQQPPQTEEIQPEKTEWEKDQREDLTDLTGLSEKERAWQFGTAGIVESDQEEDLSDLVDVSDEDIMGPKEQPKKYRVTPRGRQTIRRPLPPTMGGLNV